MAPVIWYVGVDVISSLEAAKSRGGPCIVMHSSRDDTVVILPGPRETDRNRSEWKNVSRAVAAWRRMMAKKDPIRWAVGLECLERRWTPRSMVLLDPKEMEEAIRKAWFLEGEAPAPDLSGDQGHISPCSHYSRHILQLTDLGRDSYQES